MVICTLTQVFLHHHSVASKIQFLQLGTTSYPDLIPRPRYPDLDTQTSLPRPRYPDLVTQTSLPRPRYPDLVTQTSYLNFIPRPHTQTSYQDLIPRFHTQTSYTLHLDFIPSFYFLKLYGHNAHNVYSACHISRYSVLHACIQSRNGQKLIIRNFMTCQAMNFSPVKIATTWNQLHENIVSAGTVNTFKNRLDKY
ncbi:hypothetical protein FHG87_021675 [Trinorchestia longiramus]|nr:hypothetical protein FHG87_021675 [Trinorchestia longiramus]